MGPAAPAPISKQELISPLKHGYSIPLNCWSCYNIHSPRTICVAVSSNCLMTPNAMTAPVPSSPTLDAPSAFAAIALAAVSWDGVLSMAGSRALRHSLDYRHPFCDYGDAGMVQLMDRLLRDMRQKGAQHLMVESAEALNPRQRATAYAVAAEIMRSDGPLADDERNILSNLAITLELPEEETQKVLAVMDVLHADVISS
jgi:hypothetical protein